MTTTFWREVPARFGPSSHHLILGRVAVGIVSQVVVARGEAPRWRSTCPLPGAAGNVASFLSEGEARQHCEQQLKHWLVVAGLIQASRVADALGTAETGDALVQVARNAHLAEQRCAQMARAVEDSPCTWEELLTALRAGRVHIEDRP